MSLYTRVMRRALRSTFGLWERLGVHVTPVHFYQPIPDTRRLPADVFTRRTAMPGVDMNEAGQLAFLEKLARYREEFAAFPKAPTGDPTKFHLANDSFAAIDAELLWGVLRETKPKRVVEVGSGMSTLLAAEALRRNAAEGGPAQDLTAIEPYPAPWLKALPGIRLVEKPVQEVPMEDFTRLEAGDVLFIDSTHVATIGSDVVYEILEIVPRLKPGILVHLHDIFLPYEYPRGFVMGLRVFWNEQYLLQALLAFNPGFQVLAAANWLQDKHPQKLAAAIPSWSADRVPGSFWMRRVS